MNERDSFDPEYLTPRQVAQKCGYSYKTVWRAIRAKRLRASKVTPPSGEHDRAHWRIRIEDYDAWMLGIDPPLRVGPTPIRRAG